jgi:FxsC-like protein
MPNAFAPRAGLPRLRVYLLAPTRDRRPAQVEADRYGATSLDWNPYGAEASDGLRRHLERLAANLRYEPELLSFDEVADELVAPGSPPCPAVLVIDPWALDDPKWRDQLIEFDRLDNPWVGVVAAWNLDELHTAREQDRLRQQLSATLPHRFARRLPGARLDAGIASSLSELERALSRVAQDAAIRYLRQATATRRTAARRDQPGDDHLHASGPTGAAE